jgi:hypothetical protein
VHPLAVRRHHVDRWIAEQTEAAQSKTGKPAAASTVARRMSCLSGLYEYAVVDAGLIEASPVVRVKRPKVSDHSSTVGLDEKELVKLLEAAGADGLRSAALLTLLALNGLRIGEATLGQPRAGIGLASRSPLASRRCAPSRASPSSSPRACASNSATTSGLGSSPSARTEPSTSRTTWVSAT